MREAKFYIGLDDKANDLGYLDVAQTKETYAILGLDLS